MGRGGRRSRGNPEGVPLARSVAASFPQRARANYRQRYIGQNLKAETYRFRGGPIHRKRGGRFIVNKSGDQQACQQPGNPRQHRATRQEGGRFIVVTRRPPRLRRLSPRHRPGVGDVTRHAGTCAPRWTPAGAGARQRQDGARLGRSVGWSLAASPEGTEREGASLEGRPGFRGREKAPRVWGWMVTKGSWPGAPAVTKSLCRGSAAAKP